MPKTQVWEESRGKIEDIIEMLNEHRIYSIGSLWLSILSGQFQTLSVDRTVMRRSYS